MVMAGQKKTGQAGQGRTGWDRVRKGKTLYTQHTSKQIVSTYELYSSGSQCIMEDAMRNGLLGWARAAAIIVASIPTSMKGRYKEKGGVRRE